MDSAWAVVVAVRAMVMAALKTKAVLRFTDDLPFSIGPTQTLVAWLGPRSQESWIEATGRTSGCQRVAKYRKRVRAVVSVPSCCSRRQCVDQRSLRASPTRHQ